jgi:outer membrane receptor protein involved in Fe transport
VVPSTTKAVFANVDFALTDKLNFVAGARYTDVSKTFHHGRLGIPRCRARSAAGIARPAERPRAHLRRRPPDYRAVAQYRWNDALMTHRRSHRLQGRRHEPAPFFPHRR